MLGQLSRRLLKQTGSFCRLQKVRYFAKIIDGLPDDRDVPTQTTLVNMLSADDDGNLYIHQYSNVGFTLRSGVKIFGPTVFFPRNFLSWKINSTAEINDKSLTLFSMIHPKLDVLVIGKGDSSDEVSPSVISYLRKNKINFEIVTSEQAMSTFNFLNKEHRWVAAAIIPPQFVFTQTQQDIQEYFEEKKKEANLIIEGDDEEPEKVETVSEKNIFGYHVFKSPLEPDFTDFIEEAKKVGQEDKEERLKKAKAQNKTENAKEKTEKSPEELENEDPWAEEDSKTKKDK